MSEGDVGIYSVHNACMFRGYCRKQADEITALRAALDQERAKVAALRETIEACGEWSPNSRGKLIFHFGDRWIADDQTLALLSGRGEG